ncbi:glycosyltransferase family 4 protein [Oscillospiraceae bacterium 50-60]
MKKNVWIINHYAGGMLFDQGGRHYNFAKYLKQQADYEPVIFCASSEHGKPRQYFDMQDLWQKHTSEEIGVPWVFVRARTYVGNGKQRVLNLIDFYKNVKRAAKKYTARHEKPDVIYASSPHPLTLVAGIQLAKYYRVKCICEVRDLWPESLIVYGLLKRNSLLAKALYAGEKWIYKKADALIFTMAGGCDYIVERGWDRKIPHSKVHYINNGVDLEVFDYNLNHYHHEDSDLDNPDIFKVVYAGSIRKGNKLELLLDLAKKVCNPRIRFLIWGDGDELPFLRQRVLDEHIENVTFKGRVEKKYVPSIVSRADLNYIDGNYSDLFRFGISLNKLFDYFAAGKPVIMPMKANYNPVQEFSCGLTAEREELLPQLLEQAATLSEEEYQRMCLNARKAAEEYDFKNLTQKLIQILES